MQNGSFFLPREEIHPFMNPGAMNAQEGLEIFWETDPVVARHVLPPHLELMDPEHPIAGAYVVNIREPTFAPWYMEACTYVVCRYGDKAGAYLLNLQLSGPGATMGLCSGRELSGLPKKICDQIVVERSGAWARGYVVAKGRRIFDVEVEIATGQPSAPRGQAASSSFQYVCRPDLERAPAGHLTFPTARLLDYVSVSDYASSEPAVIGSIVMEPSLDDPWAEIAVVRPLAANYVVKSEWVSSMSVLAEYSGDEADGLMAYLFTGRWDRGTVAQPSQRYGQF